MIDHSKHASLCFLSYNRLASLENAVKTATDNPGFPVEVIIHDDGSNDAHAVFSSPSLVRAAAVMLFGHPLRNEGVGRAINRSFSVATGSYLVKLDQDLVFNPNWLEKAIWVLESDPQVGMVGLFKYEHDPVDWRKMERGVGRASGVGLCPEYHYVEDFVSSAFVITRETYEMFGPLPEYSDAFAEDIEFKNDLKNIAGLKLALLDEDVCTNVGFGIGPSTVVESDGSVHKIHHTPWLLHKN